MRPAAESEGLGVAKLLKGRSGVGQSSEGCSEGERG